MTEETPELDELADKVRELWVAEYQTYMRRITGKKCTFRSRPQWDGGRDSNGRMRKSEWKRIAQFCLNNRCEYDRLIRAMFAFHKMKTPPPPNLAYGDLARERYHRFLTENPHDAIVELKVQVSEFERGMFLAKPLYGETQAAVHYVLSDRSRAMSALFRYCIAAREGLDDIASLWSADARRQYLSHKTSYDAAWGNSIPAELLEDTAHGK